MDKDKKMQIPFFAKQFDKSRSIRETLKNITLLFSLSCSIIIGILGSIFNFKAQQEIVFSKQKLIAQTAACQVTCFIQEKFMAMETTARLINPEVLHPREQKRILSHLFGPSPAIRNLVLLNTRREMLAGISRLSSNVSVEFKKRFRNDMFIRVSKGKRYISPVYIDETTCEPIIIMAVPVQDVFGDFRGTLLAEVNLKFMWDTVGSLKIGKTGLAYVVDRYGNLLAFGDIGRVMRGENVKNLRTVKQYIHQRQLVDVNGANDVIVSKGITGVISVGTYIPFGTPDWALVTEIPAIEAYRPAIETVLWMVFLIVTITVAACWSGIYVARRLTRPLENLMDTVTRITAGEMELQAMVEGPAEVAGLASTFNSMTALLREYINSLELQSQYLMNTVQKYVEYMARVGQGDLAIRLTLNEPVNAANDPLTFLGYQLNETTANLEMMIGQLQEANNRIKKRESELQIFTGKLQKSNAELEQFAYVASHDLQEPLRKIRMFNDKLQEILSGVLDERARDYLQRMNNAAIRMEKLITDLLAYSRVTTHAKPYQPVNLNETVKEVLADLEVIINETKAQITNSELPVIEADPLQMRQLFQNLIGNAIKYHRQGVAPLIRIESQTITSVGEPDYYRIDVIDNGIGFDNSYAQRIFGLFQRLHGRDKYDGTGLGLAICKKIMIDHGGAITASGQPQEGATFTLRFPASAG
jgi:signal transduction histidine kinase